jgi:hypothetical protein
MSLKAEKTNVPKAISLMGHSAFVLFRPSTDWMRAIHFGQGHLLYSVYQFKCYFHPEELS